MAATIPVKPEGPAPTGVAGPEPAVRGGPKRRGHLEHPRGLREDVMVGARACIGQTPTKYGDYVIRRKLPDSRIPRGVRISDRALAVRDLADLRSAAVGNLMTTRTTQGDAIAPVLLGCCVRLPKYGLSQQSSKCLTWPASLGR